LPCNALLGETLSFCPFPPRRSVCNLIFLDWFSMQFVSPDDKMTDWCYIESIMWMGLNYLETPLSKKNPRFLFVMCEPPPFQCLSCVISADARQISQANTASDPVMSSAACGAQRLDTASISLFPAPALFSCLPLLRYVMIAFSTHCR